MPPTEGEARARILTAARDLFGRQGFKATTIAQIEEAAGLSPGAGGLYRHFASKRALLEAGLDEQLDQGPDLGAMLAGASRGADAPELPMQLEMLARAAMARLDHERDLNRLLLRDLADFPDLLEKVRQTELRRTHAALTGWLTQHAMPGGPAPSSVATVLMSAISHYWIFTDVFGGSHPFDADREAFLVTLARMTHLTLQTP